MLAAPIPEWNPDRDLTVKTDEGEDAGEAGTSKPTGASDGD
jgi:hypothetical protein